MIKWQATKWMARVRLSLFMMLLTAALLLNSICILCVSAPPGFGVGIGELRCYAQGRLSPLPAYQKKKKKQGKQ
jgi:hypothetical protein